MVRFEVQLQFTHVGNTDRVLAGFDPLGVVHGRVHLVGGFEIQLRGIAHARFVANEFAGGNAAQGVVRGVIVFK